MAVKRGGMARQQKRGKSSGSDKLATTPTQYGETSPDYKAQAGDPDWMKSYSEEQIGMIGGRERMIQLANASQARAEARAATSGSAEGETAEVGAVPFDEVGDPGEPVASESAGAGSAGSKPKGKGTSESQSTKQIMGLKKGKHVKGRLLKRVARTQGTTVGEARGTMKRVRKQVRAGNRKGAARTLSRSLAGGKKAGVSRTPARSRQAAATAKKVVSRVQARQQTRTKSSKRKK